MGREREKDRIAGLLLQQYNTVNLTRKQAAQALNISTATLDRMKEKGIGPNYTKIETASRSNNGKVFYPITSIADYLAATQNICM